MDLKSVTPYSRFFQCQKCGAIIHIEPLDPKKYVKAGFILPTECYEDQGGCGRVRPGFLELNRDYLLNRSNIKLFKKTCPKCNKDLFSDSEHGETFYCSICGSELITKKKQVKP